MPKTIKRECNYCGTTYDAVVTYLKRNQGIYCTSSCSTSARNVKMRKVREQNEKKIIWNENIAYLTGLITSDGTLFRERKRLAFINADYELIEHVMKIVKDEITGKIYTPTPSKKKNSIWWNYKFTATNYYDFCLDLGLVPNKSLVIKDLNVPNEYFSDFLRGLIDGDGNYTLVKKKKYLNTRIFSGSPEFLEWIKKKTTELYGAKGGKVRKPKKVHCLTYYFV